MPMDELIKRLEELATFPLKWDNVDLSIASEAAAALRASAAREKGLREALEWYANPEVYHPHPHGIAFDNRDLSYHARAALDNKEPVTVSPTSKP